jgi:hypothetical protein
MTSAPQLFFDTEPVSSFDSLGTKFGPGAFASPFRSTVPLLSLVRDDWTLFEKILGECGVAGELALHFEFKVRSGHEATRPSQTDVMVLSSARALAIEAKWTEPRYESVARRLKRLPSRSKRTVTFDEVEYLATQRRFADGWIDFLRPYAESPLMLDSFGDAVYQTLHRAASACGASRPPSLAYLHFSPALGSLAAGAAGTEDYIADLRHVHNLLGHPAGFPFFVVDVRLQPTAAFSRIGELQKRMPGTDPAVRAALIAGKLFEFDQLHVHRIGRT